MAKAASSAPSVGQLQLPLDNRKIVPPFRQGLLKWVGNKQRFAHQIASHFPYAMNTYREPFVGSGAVLGALAPAHGVASDSSEPLIEIWKTLTADPELVKIWYADRWMFFHDGDRKTQYERIKSAYNRSPNGADLLFLCRSCYGGIVRFRKADGVMSTPCGVHKPMHPLRFAQRVDKWSKRVANTSFHCMHYEEAMLNAKTDDLIYCDPPYYQSQRILYGARSFEISNLIGVIDRCKSKGVKVALSIDGLNHSGINRGELRSPRGLFEKEISIDCGRSMLRRFQMKGQTLENELVKDRLLLTYRT